MSGKEEAFINMLYQAEKDLITDKEITFPISPYKFNLSGIK